MQLTELRPTEQLSDTLSDVTAVTITQSALHGQTTQTGLVITYQPDTLFAWRDTMVCKVQESSGSFVYLRYILHVQPEEDGRKFMMTFIPGSTDDLYIRKLFLYICSPINTEVTIDYGIKETISVLAGVPSRVQIDERDGQASTSEVVERKGVYIEAKTPISVVACSDKNYGSDATVVQSMNSLDTVYTVQTTMVGKTRHSEFAVVATQDGTQITITPTAATVGGHQPGVPFTVTLNRAETYLMKILGGSLTGTRVISNGKPFAMFQGADAANIPVDVSAADHTYEQALPQKYLGTMYPIVIRSHNFDLVQVTATRPNTQVYRNGILKATLDADSTYEAHESNACVYTASQPVRIMQYMTGGEWYTEDEYMQGDPSSLALNPYSQTVSFAEFYLVETQSTPAKNSFITIVTATTNVSKIKVDNSPLSSSLFSSLPGSDTLSYTTIQVFGGSHSIEAQSGVFWASCHIMGEAESVSYMVTPVSTILPDTLVSIYDTICNDTSYYFAGCHWTETGIYYDTLYSPNWNDSIVELHLQVNEVQWTDTIDTIHAGESYSWHQYTLDNVLADTVLIDTLTTVLRCDSMVQLSLVVIPQIDTIYLDTTICRKSLPFVWHTYRDTSIYQEGEHWDTLRTLYGFDKTYFCLRLSLYENDTVRLQQTICEGQLPYTWFGVKFEQEGDDTLRLTNSFGCDSIVALHLDVVAEFETDTIARVCPSDLPFNWYEHTVTTTGSYVHTFTTAALCDSIVTLTVYMKLRCLDPTDPLDPTVPCDTAYSTLDTTIYCDSLLWFEKWYYTSGTYHDTLIGAAANLCDSVGVLNLEVIDNSTSSDTTAYTCYDVPFVWHGKVAQNGDTIVRKNIVGCDSIVTLKLFVSEAPVTLPQKDTASCQMIPFIWRGHTIVSDTLCYDTIRTTKLGCDSIYASLRFVVKEPSTSDTTAYICNKDLPFIWHGKVAQNGDTIMRKNAVGCDSIVTLKLFVSEAPVTLPQKDTASCQMIPFIWRDHTIVSDTLCYDTIRTTKLGCDSIYASLRFVVKEPSISDTSAYVCYEDLPFIWHGKVAQNGDTIVRKNIVGCDSIVTLHLTVSLVMQTISKDTTVCDTVLPITWHGFEFNSVLIYRDTLLNTHGCDSLERIYTVNVIHCEPPVPPVPPTPTDTCLDSLVYKKWQDVIFCDNGRREFVAFQWFKDNTLMQGETKQYYFHEGGMGPSEYFVEVTYRDGRKRRTCPITFDETPRSADTYVKVQTLVRRGDNLHIQMTDDVADIFIYTVVGQSVMATSVRGPLVELPLPLPTGVYVLLLHASNIDTTTKIIIE